MNRKKKLKVKWKNIIIIILCITTISFILAKTISLKANTSSKDNKTKEQLKYKNELKQLDHIDEKIKYFNYNNIDRYLKYKNENKNLSLEEIITNVNIGLDKPYYENTTETTYLNKEYILVNKYHHLSENYIPKNLQTINTKYARNNMQLVDYAKNAFERMAEDALQENMTIIAISTYRDYQYQNSLYNNYVKTDGKEKADTYSARAGHSEHQTGLAVDISTNDTDYNNFEKTREFNWMQKNAHKYGFILRFPENKTKETGYQYEAWHYRYVGKEIATYIHENNLSFDEYYVQFIEK